jgi:hypothetical protein
LSQKELVFPDADSLHRALRSYEDGMMKRASVEMASSRDNLEVFFGPAAAEKVSNIFSGF